MDALSQKKSSEAKQHISDAEKRLVKRLSIKSIFHSSLFEKRCFIDILWMCETNELNSSLKTSLFKRKPDLDSAANSYAQAGLCYKIIKDYKNAIECCQKSGDCYSQNGSAYNAAK